MSGRPARRPGRPSAVALLAFVLAVAGCAPAASPAPSSGPAIRPSATSGPSSSGAASPTPGQPTVAPAAWADCGRGLQCATVVVPLDHDAVGSGVVNLSLVRIPATEQDQRIGSLFVNPGGPGGSGVDLVRDGQDLFTDLARRFDIVGFDPRGVNLSTAVRCIDNLDPQAALDPNPDNDAEVKALIDDARAYAAACQERNANLLPHLATASVVEDLELLRQAVGDEQLTYLGFSYGTLIGALYADRYPDRVRAMVLDGAVDPSISLDELRRVQSGGFEAALGRFLKRCDDKGCKFSGDDDPTRTFEAIMADIEEAPLPADRIRSRREVGPGLAWAAVLGTMYRQASWEALDQALALARQGDGSGLLLIADPYRGRKSNGTYSNVIDAYMANTCLDFPAATDVEHYTSLAEEAAQTAPHFGASSVYNDLRCAFWSVPPQRTPAPVRAAGAPPIVVVGTTGDPATPYPWAEALAEQLESGVLVRYEGEGHTAYGQTSCIDKLVDAYLVSLEVPEDGATCK